MDAILDRLSRLYRDRPEPRRSELSMAISFLAAAYTALTVERNIPGTSIVLEGSQPVIKVGSKPLVGGFHTHTKALKCFELGESESLADGITIFLAMVRVLAP